MHTDVCEMNKWMFEKNMRNSVWLQTSGIWTKPGRQKKEETMAAPSFPTPLYRHVGRGAFSDAYEPAEDTFLLLDALEASAGELTGVEICLEVGSGSGVVSAFLASVIGPHLCICAPVSTPRQQRVPWRRHAVTKSTFNQ